MSSARSYRSKSTGVSISVSGDAATASTFLAQRVLSAFESAVKSKGSFTLVVAGGSLPKALTALTDLPGPGVAWDKVHIFFVDERNVPHDSPDSSYGALEQALLSKASVPQTQVHAITEHVSVQEAALRYQQRLEALPANVLPRSAEGFPVFDMVILGIGEDAHIASLFPSWPTLSITDKWIVPIEGSPKPPPERITFTLPLINAAKDIVFFVMGAGKAEVVKRVLEVPAAAGVLPAQMVRPTAGTLHWFLEAGSAAGLSLGDKWEKC